MPLAAAVVATTTGLLTRDVRLVAVAAAALVAGGLVGEARVTSIADPGRRLREGELVTGRAHLLEMPRTGPFGASAELRMVTGRQRDARLLALMPRDAELPRELRPGDELVLSGRFRRPRSDPGSRYDHAAHLRRRGVAGELLVDRLRATGGGRGGLAGFVDGLRERADRGLAADLSPPAAALARGMVIGADEEIERGTYEDFRDSGLAHLLAVSGQNVMLLVALALPLLGLAGVPRIARPPLLIALIGLYVPLAGAGPSIQRAGVMGAAALVALALTRPASRWYVLLLAACVTLTLNPLACGDPGWQLSFAAVVGIVLLAPGIRAPLRSLPRAVAEGIAVTVAATIATAPLLAHHFGSVALAGLPANVAALPLVAPIMWIGMLRAALGQLAQAGPLAEPLSVQLNSLLGLVLAPLLDALQRLAVEFADLPGGQLRVPLDDPRGVVLAYALIAVAVVAAARIARKLDTRAGYVASRLRRMPRSRRAALVFVATAVATLLLARGLGPVGPPATLTVTFIDVGQGDATLIQHPDGSAVLFDGGPPEGDAERSLRRMGVDRLSALVMTHPSRDHHGGLRAVVERHPVDLLLDGGDGTRDRDFRAVVEAARRRGAEVVPALAPLTVRAGSLRVRLLSPSPRPSGPPPEDPNPRAVVAIVSCDGFDLLLSADAESPTLERLSLPDVDAIKLPHHGSADPGLAELLERLRPELAAITVGTNTYGHPAASTLAALRAADVPTWRTDRHGDIGISVERGVVDVDVERGEGVDGTP